MSVPGRAPRPLYLLADSGLLFWKEADGWRELRRVVADRGEGARGLGIPRGGAVVCGADGAPAAVRRPTLVLENGGGEVTASLLVPLP
ncbi:MAG TPA: hypothetical protein VFX98_16010 [Longimicrobiaceae bacterium]|nr:hypothetical protein [Longimicrobiaceae bacterium]